MMRRKKQQPEHENPHEARIVRAVEAAGVSDEERPFYLIFARELDVRLCHSHGPDFSPATKRLAMRWFERGLSGHKLWLIGEALLQNPNSGTALSELHR